MAEPAAPKRAKPQQKIARELVDEKVEFTRAPVWVGNVTDGTVRTEFSEALSEMRIVDSLQGWGLFAGKITNHSGANISKARNDVVTAFLEHPPAEAEWLLWLDSDMVPPPDLMARLLAAAKVTDSKVVGALCVMRKEEGPTPTIYQLAPEGADGVTIVQFDYDEDSITEVAATGCACVIIHREVFERVAAAMPGRKYPWYWEREVNGHWVGEDIGFHLMVHELGYRQYVDCTTHVGHAKDDRVWWPADIKKRVGFPRTPVTVVIPVKDRLDLTSSLVHQLRTQGEADDIVICDNGSGTKLKNWLASQDGLVVLDMPEAGINEMWNAGALWALKKHGPRSHVAILNNDLDVGPGFLGELSRALDADRDLIAASGNYDGRRGGGLVQEVYDICAGRYDGSGGFGGFAFAVKGSFFEHGYRFPEVCQYWFGDNDLIQAIAWTPEGKAGIALRAEVTHLDGGSKTAGDAAWTKFAEETAKDQAAYEKRWRDYAVGHVRHQLGVGATTADQATELLGNMGVQVHQPTEGARVCVMTAVFAGYDFPSPLIAQDLECDAILITDKPTEVPGWRNVVVESPVLHVDRVLDDEVLDQVKAAWEAAPAVPVVLDTGAQIKELPARLQAKRPRCRPDHFTHADVVVWLDAHVEVRSPSFIRELLDQLGDGLVGAFRHGFHTSISQEAALASTLPKYEGWDLVAQAKNYLEDGHPDAWGMWTTGVMVRRPAFTRAFGDDWQAEIDRWGPEDQISLPVVLRRHDITPVDLPFEGWWKGDRFMLHPHNDGSM